VVGLTRWGGGARRQQSWLCQSGSRASRTLEAPWYLRASRVRELALALWRREACFLGWGAGRGSRLSGAFCGWAPALGWWCATPAELAFPKRQQGFRSPKRNGTAGLLECESLLSLCGGGKLASWGGALGVDRDCRGLFVVGLDALGWWCATPAELTSPKRKQSFAHSRSVMVPARFSSARACSRFVAEGSLLPGVGRWAWIAVEGASRGWAHTLGWWGATPAGLAFPKRKQSFAHSRSALVPARFSSARACSRFVAEGSLLPGVGRWAWIAIVGSFPWLGSSAGVVGSDASRAGFAKAAAGLPQSKSVLVPARFSSARACSRFVAEGSLLPGVGRWAWIAIVGSFPWLGSHAGVVGSDASRAGFAKAAAGLPQSKSALVPARF
jgi:hypothetical protein